MQDHKPHTADVNSQIKAFMSGACAGDVDAIRVQVAEGFDLNGTNQFGDTILEYAISALEFYPGAPKYKVIEEMLRLGADPNAPSQDDSRPLFAAVLNLDSEMLRLLLDAGANPNVLRTGIDGTVESLYDWACSAYWEEAWSMYPAGEMNFPEREDEDAWLRHLARLALKYDKPRPDHLQVLRERGALSTFELCSVNRTDPRAKSAAIAAPQRSSRGGSQLT